MNKKCPCCNSENISESIGVVCDPFMGSGTTAVVAEKMQRRWIGIEASNEYVKAIKMRLERKK